jgi:hypothetical protein
MALFYPFEGQKVPHQIKILALFYPHFVTEIFKSSVKTALIDFFDQYQKWHLSIKIREKVP